MSESTEVALRGITEEEFIREAEENKAFTKDESVIPFTRILQPLSPQLEGNDHLKPGMLYNMATDTAIDGSQGMTIVPVAHMWNFTEWTPRNEGGGFIADWGEDETGWHPKCEPGQRNAYQPKTKDGHIILRARHFFIFQIQNGGIEASILPFTGTMLKVARAWSNMMSNAPKIKTAKGMMTPAYYYYTYKITTEETKNAKGRWWLPKIQLNTDNGKAVSVLDYPHGKENLWDRAVAFRQSLKAGEIKAAQQEHEASSSEDETF